MFELGEDKEATISWSEHAHSLSKYKEINNRNTKYFVVFINEIKKRWIFGKLMWNLSNESQPILVYIFFIILINSS